MTDDAELKWAVGRIPGGYRLLFGDQEVGRAWPYGKSAAWMAGHTALGVPERGAEEAESMDEAKAMAMLWVVSKSDLR